MAKRKNEIMVVIDKFLREVQKSGIRVEKAYLFGSRAKGKADTHSDIDIAVISSDFEGNRFKDMGLLTPLTWNIDLRLEPIGFRPEDFQEDLFGNEIRDSGIEVPIPQ